MSDRNYKGGSPSKDGDYGVSPPTVWSIVQGHIGSIVDQAIQQSHFPIADGNRIAGGFKMQLADFLRDPLQHVVPNLHVHPRLHIIHQEIKEAIEGAVDSAMRELNMTSTNSSARESLVTSLDNEIEMDVLNNKAFANMTYVSKNNPGFFHSMTIKDEAIFVALVSMGVIIPIIFFTLLIIFFYRRYKEIQQRRHEMLLRDQPEFSMEDYNSEDKSQWDEEVPDLDLKRLRV